MKVFSKKPSKFGSYVLYSNSEDNNDSSVVFDMHYIFNV